MKRTSAKLPADLADAREQFESWRARGRARRPLPDELWKLAADLVPSHGVHRVSKALRLEYYQVKRHAQAERAERSTQATPAFVEVVPTTASVLGTTPGFAVELSDSSGRRMTIRSSVAVDAAGLIAAFCGAAR